MKPKSIHGTTGKALRKNRKGGIEGLPLQLMIIIMVATLGTAIIMVQITMGPPLFSGSRRMFPSRYRS